MCVWVCGLMLKSRKTEKKKEIIAAQWKIITTFATIIEFIL